MYSFSVDIQPDIVNEMDFGKQTECKRYSDLEVV